MFEERNRQYKERALSYNLVLVEVPSVRINDLWRNWWPFFLEKCFSFGIIYCLQMFLLFSLYFSSLNLKYLKLTKMELTRFAMKLLI